MPACCRTRPGKVATPVAEMATGMPLAKSAGPLAAIATTAPEIGLPCASRTVTVIGASAWPAVVVAGVVIVSWLAAPGATVNEPDVADGRLGDVKLTLYVPALFRTRPLNVAMPLL